MGDYFCVKGGEQLCGKVELHGAKNAVLPLLALGMLTKDDVIVRDCPLISDVYTMISLLKSLGLTVSISGREICVSGEPCMAQVQESLCRDMRSSMFMLGALLCACKEVKMPLPGGCVIGARPLDIHFDGLKKMGAEVQFDGGYIRCFADKLHGADVVMRYPSVGATENLLMCASLASGRTTLINCAREPEIQSLAQALRSMGAKISGEGTSVIKIDGVDKLCGCRVLPPSDRIAGGTYICASALCGGDVFIENVDVRTVQPLVDVLRNKDCKIDALNGGISVKSCGRAHSASVITAPYPLFPTDLQPQLLTYACFADGASRIEETVFENRFGFVEELKKTGLKVSVSNDRIATVVGCNSSAFGAKAVRGADMVAKDLRGGAGLLLAGLKIKGESKVFNAKFVDRGYENIEDVFVRLGAHVMRKNHRCGSRNQGVDC